MRVKPVLMVFILVLAMALASSNAEAKSRATVKRQTIRDENPKVGKEWLVLPYAFATDDLGTVLGVGGGGKVTHPVDLTTVRSFIVRPSIAIPSVGIQ